MEQLHKVNADSSRRNSDPSVKSGTENGAAADHETSASSVEVLQISEELISSDGSSTPSDFQSSGNVSPDSTCTESPASNGIVDEVCDHCDYDQLDKLLSSSKTNGHCDTDSTSTHTVQNGDCPKEGENPGESLPENCEESSENIPNGVSNTTNPSSLLSERLAGSESSCQADRYQNGHSLDSSDLTKALDSSKHSDNSPLNSSTSKSLIENGFQQRSCDIPIRLTSSENNLESIPSFQKQSPNNNHEHLVKNKSFNGSVNADSNGQVMELSPLTKKVKSSPESSASSSSNTLTVAVSHSSESHSSLSCLPSYASVTAGKKDQVICESFDVSTGIQLKSQRARAASGASREHSVSPSARNGNWTDTARLRHTSGGDQVLKRCISTAVSTSTTDISDSSVAGVSHLFILQLYPL